VLNTAVSGTTVTQLRDDIYLVNVVARADGRGSRVARRARDAAGAGAGRAHRGAQLLRHLLLHQEQPLVWRRDRVPTLTVLADVVPGRSCPRPWSRRSRTDIAALNASLPVGYRIEVGGTAETSAESQAHPSSPSCR
jgi:multidrug efflux pump